MSNNIAIIGAVNLDINIHTDKPYTFQDSNIIDAIQNVGGVGGNIAQNIARLGHHVTLLSVFGTDPVSQSLRQSLEQLTIDTTHSAIIDGNGLNLYLSILDPEHDLLLGLNDMKAMNHITIDFIQSKAAVLETFETIIIDNNLRQDVLEYIVSTYHNKRLVMDAVSVDKAHKLQSIASKLTILKVNQLEYEALGTLALHSPMLELIVSNGPQTIHVHHDGSSYPMEPKPCEHIHSASGAGDALLSGYIDGRLRGLTIPVSLERATQIAYITLQSNTSTSDEVKPIG